MLSGFGWIWLFGASAWAKPAEVAVVGAHLPDQTDAQAQALAAELEQALIDLNNLDPIQPGQVRGRLSGREALVVEGVFLSPGRAALEEGRVLYQRADFDNATSVLELAVDALLDGLAGAGDSKDLIDALLLLGLSRAALGEEDAARDAFRQVVILEPQRQLDRINYPPKMVNLFSSVREEMLTLERGTLTLITVEGARIWLDGRSQPREGRSLKIPDMLPGRHYVLVQDEGGRRFFEAIDLTAEGQTLKIDASERLIAPSTADRNEQAMQIEQLYQSLGEYAETEMILIAGQTGPETVAVQLYEPRTGTFSRIAEERIRETGPAAALKIATLNLDTYVEDGTLRVEFVSLGAPPLDINANPLLSSMLLDPEPIVEKVVKRRTPWYFWAGVGVVAAGGATSAALLLAPEPDPTGTVIVNLPD
ncbi:MAG: hypothetical protein AAFV53_22305 [Myxococcota bacterium]